jgi:valyl-tRNA synthetase
MDTWATSSLSPQIACGWERDPELFALTFPMDMAPQAHDIIRTWLFSRVVRSHFEFDCVPWSRATISGFVVDPDRKKMGKSTGNAIVPTEILEKYGSDAVRWRAAMARPGTDSPFDETQMKVGRRLAMKVLNASKFVLSITGLEADPAAITQPADLAMLESLRGVVGVATQGLEEFEYTDALEATERFFWGFCDDYLELVKERAYAEGPGAESAKAALVTALGVLLRLFAPYLPFVTEEVWSWSHETSVHLTPWPTVNELPASDEIELMDDIAAALVEIRGAKSQAKVSMKTEALSADFRGPSEQLERLKTIEKDLRAVGRLVGEVMWTATDTPLTVTLELAPQP